MEDKDDVTPQIEVIIGQICYDELELIPLEEETIDVAVIEGQLNLSDIEIQKTNITENLNKERTVKEKQSKTKQLDISSIEPKNIVYKSLEEVFHDSMIPYTEHVVMDRALPRVEDGLKPVQRRILYSMLELGLEPDKPYRKSARIVGDCMGKYHPHGDSSVYDAMVRMAQPFMMSEPLVDGHGNFGSIDGDSAAAMRYTEAKLAPLALELLRDLDKNTVHWSLNFDDTLKEPDMLPGRFPNLLVNGASGIAVGVATNIPPHNLTEVCDAVIAYINKPSIKLEEIMHYIKAPDFPTGGQLIVGEDLVNAYRTGKGKITIRATVNIETEGDKQSIVITSLPYQTNKVALLQKIAELKENNKDKLAAISEIRDESDKNGMRAVIKLKKEGNAKAILDYLFKATGMQVSFGINMVAIADGKPKLMGLLDIISYYVEYQREIIQRRTKFDLDACKERAHIIEGLLVAIKNIDEVVKIIKKSSTTSEAKIKLRERFNLSDRQAQAILDMRLARLVNLEITKLEEEHAALIVKIQQLTEIYNSKKLQLGVVKEELTQIKKQYKSERKSIISDSKDIVYEEVDEVEAFAREVVIAKTASNTLKNIPLKNYNLAQKEITDTSTLNDVHTILRNALTSQKALVFTNLGNCIKVDVGEIQEGKWRDKGCMLSSLDKNSKPDETVVEIRIIDDEELMSHEEIIFFTSSGMVKKSSLGEYFIAKNYFQAIKLKDDDRVVAVQTFNPTKSILMMSKNGMVLNFENLDIQSTGRVSSGVKGMNIDDGDEVVFADQVMESGALTIGTEKGYFKNVPIGEFEVMSRYRKGLRVYNTQEFGKIKFGKFGIVPPTVAVKTENKVEKVSARQIAYDSRLGKGKQNIKAKIKDIFEYVI
ncbi:MAG: DNA topoisomerase 4 subunit A [Clostridia bacterium]|nr:DNA topoisomerase 4 subunit A [Clostridia bacterium]